jgi:hypothetical protein
MIRNERRGRQRPGHLCPHVERVALIASRDLPANHPTRAQRPYLLAYSLQQHRPVRQTPTSVFRKDPSAIAAEFAAKASGFVLTSRQWGSIRTRTPSDVSFGRLNEAAERRTLARDLAGQLRLATQCCGILGREDLRNPRGDAFLADSPVGAHARGDPWLTDCYVKGESQRYT